MTKNPQTTTPTPEVENQTVAPVGEQSVPDAPAFTFTPETGEIKRASKPNPFVEVVKALTVNGDEGIGFDCLTADLPKIRGQLDRAAKEANVTARWAVTATATGSHVFVKAVTRQAKPRKSDDK